MPMDYKKLAANREGSVVSVWIGPSGGTTLGVTNLAVPEAAELNNTGGTSGMQKASQSISWNDWDFGIQASETNSEPSMADSASYEEFGQTNFGGGVSFYMPYEYDDNTNQHSVIYDLTDEPGTVNDIFVRIDGAAKTVDTPAANGDYVSGFRVQTGSEDNPFTPGESKRRTVGFNAKGGVAPYTIVGPHTLTIVPPASTPWSAGRKGRLRVTVGGRDYTNALRWTSNNGAAVQVYPGGFYHVTGVAGGTAIITARDEKAGTTVSETVTITAP